MGSKKQSDYRSVDGIINSSRNVPPSEDDSANSPGLRRTARKNAWGKQLSSISKTPAMKFDHGSSACPSSRKSERLEKLLPSPGKKKPQITEEQKTPSPLRRSERSNKGTMLNRSNLKRKWMDGRTYKALFGPPQGTSNGNVNDLEPVLVKHDASKGELDVRKKRKKTTNTPTSPSSELGRNETEPIEKGARNSTGLQPVSVTQSSKGEASEMQQKFHLLLKSNIAKVSEVLQLPDDVKITAGELLDYIIDNYHISWESESIFHAFLISLCWNAASLVKREIYKDKSLLMVKKHLNFRCTEEEANLAYWRMRKIKEIILKQTLGLKESNKYSKDLVLLTADGSIGLTLAEKGMESHFKELKKSNEKNIERLMLQQDKEIHDLENEMEQKREEVNTDYRMHVAVIRFIYGKSSMISEKLKRNEEDLDRRMEELKQQEERYLKVLKEKHVCEMIVEMKNSTDKCEKLKSFSPADFSGDSALYGVKPVVVGEQVLSIGSESFKKTDKTWSTSDEPKLVSSWPKTCIDDLSGRQPVNGTVGFTPKPRGSSDIDTFPGVLNPESEQPPHCSSAYLTGILVRSPLQLAPHKDLSSSSKVPSKSSSTMLEVSDSTIVTEVTAAHCQVDKAEVSDSIIVTEVIAAHCQVDKTSSVVIDEMRSQNDTISPSTNFDKICCEEPGSVDRERLQQQSLDFSKSLSTVMKVCDSLNATELVAEHVQTDETSLVVIDEMRNQNDKISQPANSNNDFYEEPGSVDRERLQHESTQVMVDSGSFSGPNDPNCDKLLQVELPLLLNESRPIDKTHGGEPLTIEMDSIHQESLAGSTIIADLINVSGQDGQKCGEHIGNVDRGSSQQVSLAESQAGADSCSSEVDLHKVSDVVEGTPTTDNTILPPASVIAGSQAAADSSNNAAGSTVIADLMNVNVFERDGQNCGEHIGNVDSGSSQVSIAESQAGADSCNSEVDLHRVSDVLERTPTTDNTILPPASVIAGSQAGADSSNNDADLHRISDAIETNTPKDNALLPPASVIARSQTGADSSNNEAYLHSISDAIQTNTPKDNALLPPASVIARSQTGADSSNNEAYLHSISDAIETNTPKDNALLPPASVIAGSNEASGFAIQPNIDICSSIQGMTASVQVVGSAVLLQETTQIPTSHHSINISGPSTVQSDVFMHEPLNNDLTTIVPPANVEVLEQQYDITREECPNQLISARDLRCFPSVNVSPLRQGTQLPMVIGQPRTSNLPNHSSFHDLLQIEADRLSKEMEQLIKILNDKRSVIESARAKELEEVNKKYNAEIKETETAIASNVNELFIRRERVQKNKTLAEGFCSKFDVRANGLSFINNMQQLTRHKALIRPTTNGTGADPSLTHSEIPIASSSLTCTVQQSSPIISTIPVQASQSTSLTSLKENLQVREVTPMANCKRPRISPSPPTQSVLQSAPRVSSIPARTPHRASLTRPKKNLQVHGKIPPIAPSPPTHSVPQSALVISKMRPIAAPRGAPFIFPPIKVSPSPPTQSVQQSAPKISNRGIPPIAPSPPPPTQSALQSAMVISNVQAKAPRGETFTLPPIKLQAGGGTRLPAPHLHFKPSSLPVASCNSSVRANVYGIPDESLNPLLRPVGSITGSDYRHGLQTPRRANPVTPTSFPRIPSGPSPRPTTPHGFSSVRPVIPTNPTECGVAVQPEIAAPPVVVNEADNEDAGTR